MSVLTLQDFVLTEKLNLNENVMLAKKVYLCMLWKKLKLKFLTSVRVVLIIR